MIWIKLLHSLSSIPLLTFVVFVLFVVSIFINPYTDG